MENLQGLNSGGDEAKIQINDLENKEEKQHSIRRVRRKKESPQNGGNVSSLWDNFQRSNICVIGMLEGKEKEQGIGNLFEKIMKENFPDLVKEIDMQFQEAQRILIMMDAKRPTPRHIIIKMPNVKQR